MNWKFTPTTIIEIPANEVTAGTEMIFAGNIFKITNVAMVYGGERYRFTFEGTTTTYEMPWSHMVAVVA